MCKGVKVRETTIIYNSNQWIIISPDFQKQLLIMHPSLWMQGDFYEIRASFDLQEFPIYEYISVRQLAIAYGWGKNGKLEKR